MQNRRSNCCDARPYYYDILCEESHEDIPSAALMHVSECNYCQREIVRLEGALNEDNTPSAAESRRDAKLLQLLRLHFSYADKPVTCSIVKPFLPSMADELVRIRIPTPITTHIDQCTRCASDLSALRDLELSRERSDHLVSSRQTGEEPSTCLGGELLSEDGETADAADANESGVEIPIPVDKPLVRSSAKDWPFVKTGLHLLESHVGKIAAVLAISITLLVLTNVAPVEAGLGSLWHEAIQNTPYFDVSCTFPGRDGSELKRTILRDRRKYIEVDGDSSKLYDLPVREIREIKTGTLKLEVEAIPPHELQHLEQEFKTLAGLVSFGVLDKIPAHAMHKELEVRVHEYVWQSSAHGRRFKCVVSLAANRDFPEKLKVSVQEPGQDKFQPDRTIRIDCPSEAEANAKVDGFILGPRH
jgi:hypothetical protein